MRTAGPLIAALLAAALACAARASANTDAILMYHHVSPTVQPGPYARALTVSPSEFEEQVRWLRARGCLLVTVDRAWSDALAGTVAPCEAALTFDDGYEDVARYALPILLRYGAVGTLYIATGFIGRPDHLSIGDLRSAEADGMEIGAHTIDHVDLTKLPPARAQGEIEGSALAIESTLGKAPTTFAYPSGKFTPRIVQDVASDRFETAVTTNAGTLVARADPFELPRYRITHGQGMRLLGMVFGPATRGVADDWAALSHVARERIAGNDPAVAETMATALLAQRFPEQITKVRVERVMPATVAGIVLSGRKFHAAVDRERFAQDVREMVGVAFAVAPSLDEVDVWATVPIPVAPGTIVSGDEAVPTERTVFSAAVVRGSHIAGAPWDLGVTYWDHTWL
jgi:peptidoglycan/xylan/chitin deacetylase (PgdA/CDA1 family)